MTRLVEAALAWHEAGCSIISVAQDGTKAPWADGPEWTRYMTERASREQVIEWASERDGIGVVCGAISGNLELFELAAPAVLAGLHDKIREAIPAELWNKLSTYCEMSAGGGLHWLYRCEVPVATTKLARAPREPTEDDPRKIMTLIETKGEGGFCVLAPSGGRVHPSGRSWAIIFGTAGVVPTLTELERETLLDAARDLDELPPPVPLEHRPSMVVSRTGELSPGQDYEARADWMTDILGPLGWRIWQRSGDKSKLTRPGKKFGTSATLNYDGNDNLYVFTSSADPFQEGCSYTKFGAYALLHHDGDFPKAAAQLRKDGYGSPSSPPTLVVLPGGRTHTLMPTEGAAAMSPATDGEIAAVTLMHSDDANALQLVGRIKGTMLYCPERKQWLAWDGSRYEWQQDSSAPIQAMREIGREMEALDRPAEKHRLYSLSNRGVQAALKLTENDPSIHVRVSQLDAEPWSMNTPDGVCDLRTGLVMPSSPTGLHTRMARFTPDFTRVPEKFIAFLRQIMSCAVSPESMVTYLQMIAGYSAVGAVTHQIFPFLHGTGANGKTVLMEILSSVMGDYSVGVPSDFLLLGGRDESEAEAKLAGARLVVCSEVPPTAKFNEAKLKRLTGGDPVTARFLYGHFFTFTPSHHLWLLGNHEPRVEVGGDSLWRRMKKIPFGYVVAEHDREPELASRIIAEEGPAILAWIINGARMQMNGLPEPGEVTMATATYAEEEDHIGRFLSECVIIGGAPVVKCNTKIVRAAYEKWCNSEGEKPMSTQVFGRELRLHGVGQDRSNGQRFYLGVTLTNTEDSSSVTDHSVQESFRYKD
jgi:P4 family phage/plasmid primase-like protien